MPVFLAVCTVCEGISYIPQIVKLIRTKRGEDLSILSWIVWVTSALSYLLYLLTYSVSEFGLVLLASLELTCCLVILCLSVYYRSRGCPDEGH